MAYRVNLYKMCEPYLDELFAASPSNIMVALELTRRVHTDISRQNVEYWRKIHDTSRGKTNTAIKEGRVLREPTERDWEAVGRKSEGLHEAIIVIPDLHIPYHHPDAFDFLRDIKGMYPGATVVCLGDEVDNHALSFHDSDPNLDSAGAELAKAREAIAELESLFPQMLICHSNHGSLQFRRAKAHGIPVEYLRTYREVMFPDGRGTGWEWAYSHTLRTSAGDVLFKHQCSGDPKLQAAHEGTNLVVGHNHGRFDLSYGASTTRLYYGATAGCLLDKDSLAFAYGRETTFKPILGCVVIEDGIPRHIPMEL